MGFRIRKSPPSLLPARQSHIKRIPVGRACFSLHRPTETGTRFSDVAVRPEPSSGPANTRRRQRTWGSCPLCTSHTGKQQNRQGLTKSDFVRLRGCGKETQWHNYERDTPARLRDQVQEETKTTAFQSEPIARHCIRKLCPLA